jgi:hypothetical protein
MPIAIAAVEIYEGVAAYTAATTVLMTVAAGAMIAGGAVAAIGVATGNKDLQNGGLMLAAAGSLGTLAAGSTTAVGADQGAASGAADSAGGATYMGQGNADTVFGDTGIPATLGVTPKAPAATGSTTAAPADSMAAKIDAIKKSQEAMQKYSLISGTLQGAGTAYSGWAQQEAQREISDKQLAFQRELANRANSVGSVALKPAGLLSVGGRLPSPVAPVAPPQPAALNV